MNIYLDKILVIMLFNIVQTGVVAIAILELFPSIILINKDI